MTPSTDTELDRRLDELLAVALTTAYTRGKTATVRERIFEVTQPERDEAKAQIKQLIARERQNALEDVGAIGADYSDSQDTEYRDAVEGYIISQRRTLQAQADKGEQE